MDLKQCQIGSDGLVNIDALDARIAIRLRDLSGIIHGNLMPYTAKMRAQSKINEIQEMLVLIEDQKKPIYEILKQEREGQE